MLRKNLSLIVVSITVILSAFVGNAYAATIPTFPACANPQGQVKSSYENGTHGVAGDSATYTGKDTVYSLSDNTLTQCLCPSSGNGVQTNWWKANALSQEEIDVLISQGWILLPDGASWGLDSGPYLAKNSSYSCTSTNNGGSGGTSDSKSADASILATSTQAILALANTGNIVFILGVFLAGIVLVGLGIALSFKKRG